MAIIKKAQNGATTKPKESLSQKNSKVMKEIKNREAKINSYKKEKEKNSYSNSRANKVVAKKAQKGISVGKLKKVSDSLNTVGNQKVNAGVQRTVKSGYDSTSKELVRSGKKDISNATRYSSIIKKKKS